MALIPGSPGNDTLNGTTGADTIIAGGGRDIVNADAGDDRIELIGNVAAGSTINGGAGTDTIALAAIPAAFVSNNFTFPGGLLSSAHNLFVTATITSIERIVFSSAANTNITGLFGFGGSITNQIGGNGIAANAEIVGGAGFDTFNLLYGFSETYTVTLPSFTLTGWQTAERAYLPQDRISLSNVGSAGNGTINIGNHVGLVLANTGAGNDVVNGSAGMELILYSGGLDTILGGGGNDTLALINQAFIGTGGTPAPNFTAEGTIFNGGDGFDFLGIGGVVDFKGTLQNIEGIWLTPSFAATPPPGGGPAPQQEPTELRLSMATLASLPGNLEIDGKGKIVVTVDGATAFNGSNYVFTAGSDVSFVINGSPANQATLGTSVRDTITGDEFEDTIHGGGGGDSLSSGGGNDVLYGEQGNDTLDGGQANDSLIGGDGDDVLIAGAGNDTLEGGAGNDVAVFSGNRSAYTVTQQQGGAIIVSGGPDGSDRLTGIETYRFADGDFVFDAQAGALIGGQTGVVSDGHISGATVYLDIDNDGVLDAGEPSTTSAADGTFVLPSGTGTLRAFGGTNVDTGLANTMLLSAPNGASVINPLTTLVQTVAATEGISAAQAEAEVKEAFGIDASLSLLTFDLQNADPGNADHVAAQQVAASVVEIVSTIVDVTPAAAAQQAGIASLAEIVHDAAVANTPVSLADAPTLQTVIADALPTATQQELSTYVQVTQGQNAAIAQATSIAAISQLQGNQAPELTGAKAVLAAGTEDVAYTASKASLITGYTDADADALSVINVTASQGTAVINGDGSVTVTPPANYNGAVTLTYQVSDGRGGIAPATQTFTLASVNDIPDANNDSARMLFNAPVTIAVLANDSDAEGGTLLVTNASDPPHGTTVVNAGGTITYTPDAGYRGADIFTYTISDGQGGTDTATVTLAAPVFPMAQTVLTPGQAYGVTGFLGFPTDVFITGTTAGAEVITIGDFTTAGFSNNFSSGGDTIRMTGQAANFDISVSGNQVSLVSTLDQITLVLPVGFTNVTIVFETTANNFNDSRALRFVADGADADTLPDLFLGTQRILPTVTADVVAFA